MVFGILSSWGVLNNPPIVIVQPKSFRSPILDTLNNPEIEWNRAIWGWFPNPIPIIPVASQRVRSWSKSCKSIQCINYITINSSCTVYIYIYMYNYVCMYIYIISLSIYIYYIIITKYITIFWFNIVKTNWFIGFTTFCKTMHSLGETRTKMHPAKTSVLKFLFLPPGRKPHV